MVDMIGFNPWLGLLLLVWVLPWKGVALWHAARNRQTGWYVALFLIQTLGILEIIYLFFFRPKTHGQTNGANSEET